jgi:hypothetical protein
MKIAQINETVTPERALEVLIKVLNEIINDKSTPQPMSSNRLDKMSKLSHSAQEWGAAAAVESWNKNGGVMPSINLVDVKQFHRPLGQLEDAKFHGWLGPKHGEEAIKQMQAIIAEYSELSERLQAFELATSILAILQGEADDSRSNKYTISLAKGAFRALNLKVNGTS